MSDKRELGPNPYTRGGKVTPEKKADAIAHIRVNGPRLAGVCKHIDCSARLIEIQLKEDPYFEEAWREAEAEFVSKLEDELHRRAVEGVTEVQFFQGQPCGQVQRYSDTLLALAIKRRDHGYREKLSADVSFGGGVLVVSGAKGNETDEDWAKKFSGDKPEGDADAPDGNALGRS